MIVGAYPSAKFYTVNNITDTPLSDNNSPFSNESYFDGSRVRTIPSGKELNEEILEQIGISREDCWITNLVKVFLFKEGHIERYKKLGKSDVNENRSKYKNFAKQSLIWLEREIELCNPLIIILLGAEVTESFWNISASKSTEYLDGMIRNKEINGVQRHIISLPHPGILMRNAEWKERFKSEISIKAKDEILKLKKW